MLDYTKLGYSLKILNLYPKEKSKTIVTQGKKIKRFLENPKLEYFNF